MRALALVFVTTVAGVLGVPEGLRAQEGSPAPTQFVTLDRDRLFQGTQFGRRVIEQLANQGLQLAEETQELEAALEAEELALTEARKTLTPAEFRAKADAFDEKVVALRAEAELASARFTALRASEQRMFEERVVSVLRELVADLGAVAILDRTAILLSARNIDITDLAIARIDATLGDGTQPEEQPADDPGVSPQPETPSSDGAAPKEEPADDPGRHD
ncbi:OmpH family outer membrane protein [Aliiroseovarius sp.]|uniref:OmpH family outer membrane protein n=1 Tax=Aliiroseovarius sp. TaxID=1872442 RepID=UPI00260CB307|nr:OmpH family outer membrane protein [Aliiroseovarius sp.]